MTRIEYDLLREQEPQLRLPPWQWWQEHWDAYAVDPRDRLKAVSREEMIAGRTAAILGCELGLTYDIKHSE